jgi:hypothetical protein
MAGNLITAHKNEKIPISVMVPSTVGFPLFYLKINCHASYAVWGYLIFKLLVLGITQVFYIENSVSFVTSQVIKNMETIFI